MPSPERPPSFTLVRGEEDSSGAARETLAISSALVLRGLSAVVAALLAANAAVLALRFLAPAFPGKGTLVFLFSVDREGNVPSWFSSVLLLGCGGLLAILAWTRRREPLGFATRWMSLALGFVLLSVDEVVTAHEQFGRILRDSLATTGVFHFAWTLPAIPLVLALGLWLRRPLAALPVATRRGLLLAAAVYLGGALGMELVGGYHRSLYGTGASYALVTTVEEALEMVGLVVMIRTLLDHLAREAASCAVGFAR